MEVEFNCNNGRNLGILAHTISWLAVPTTRWRGNFPRRCATNLSKNLPRTPASAGYLIPDDIQHVAPAVSSCRCQNYSGWSLIRCIFKPRLGHVSWAGKACNFYVRITLKTSPRQNLIYWTSETKTRQHSLLRQTASPVKCKQQSTATTLH